MVHQIFTKFAIGLVTGQVKVLAWSRYDAEKQDNLVDTSKLFSSVGWNLVNWNVERTWICLSESAPSYGVDSSFEFSFLRVLPEPNLQESEERRGSRHSFFACEPLWTCLVRRYFPSLQKISCTRQFESKLSLRSFALSLHQLLIIKQKGLIWKDWSCTFTSCSWH